ncbi:motility associated factor glycosyltransferase family protein, partial [Campylobacter coli]|nr:motility associated factor glycosyltransferase family protein [Campylobacter coli]EIB1713234.1 motility associated factor glycosyltransferase family protein [Campylobacter coli]EIT4353435.1 motility associated factor glycosyltransferase family protein [Campylobacter coli]EKS2686783.1 motility associated factor glycosyltransferase family protein [Campylobacter coli]ELM1240680.1 motility associated factor glycosyltransferase family protein [Campylobacter coli]
ENNFNKNLKALSGFEYNNLRKKLEDLKELREFTFTQGKDNLDINIIKKRNLKKMYQDPIKELEKNLEYFKDFTRYPVLFFYGFGNGILYKILLQNQALKRIIIFEKELELIFLALNFIDFSKDLSLGRLIILHHDDINLPKMDKVFRLIGDLFYRSYNLHIANDFYEHYKEDILKLNKLNMQIIKNHNLMRGNDPKDAMQGIEQFVYNLPQMITHPSYKELLSKRKGISDTAIIVSTGPSLTKQLPLLKKYASKATIFCADSSYPILAKHGIKPDYVCMLERTEITAEFFNHDFGEFDKDIVFICAGVVHPKAIEYLKGRNLVITQKVLAFPYYINLKDFSYAAVEFSVAHMSYFLSVLLNHKNIIFIGQDLAYAENGNSHPDDYQNSANYESQMYKHILTEAYGGKKEIKTHEVWIFFKQILEAMIIKYHITTYNCTEGGARIEGTIEKPFLWACENLLDKDLNKPFEKLEPLSLNKQNEFLLKAYYKVCKSIKHCRDFSKILSNDFEKIQSVYLSLNEKEEYLNLAIEKIDEFKNKLEDIKQMQDLYEILSPLLIQFELNLARIYVLNPKTKEDAFNKSILWIKEHLEFMELVYGHIKAQENALIKNILPLEEKLKERKLDKWMERVRK